MDTPIDATILQIIERHPHVRFAVLFGSLASGQARPESDLDLAVDAGRPLTANEKMALIGDLALEIGRPVDLIDLHSVGEPLLGQIVTGGRRVMGSDAHYAEVIRKHVFDATDFLPYRTRILSERRQGWIGR